MKVSTKLFSYRQGVFTAFISDLGKEFNFGRLGGLTLVSESSGIGMEFNIDHIEKDSEGDILSWTLVPICDDALKITIFND